MFYMKGPESLAEQLTMPLCNDPCSLTEFINITSKYIPVNWDEECESNT